MPIKNISDYTISFFFFFIKRWHGSLTTSKTKDTASRQAGRILSTSPLTEVLKVMTNIFKEMFIVGKYMKK